MKASMVDMCERCNEKEADVIEGPICQCNDCYSTDPAAKKSLAIFAERERFEDYGEVSQ